MEKRDGLREAPKRILDAAARERRQRKALELLELDNHMEEPQSDVKLMKRPHFAVETEGPVSRKRKKRTHGKIRKTLDALLEEEYQATKGGTTGPCYFTATVPPSRLPVRKLCNVCGYKGLYNCVLCSAPYCCRKCYDVHTDTRCMKWVA